MATIDELSQALINADAAGDADAARTFAAEIQRMRSMPAAPVMAPGEQPAIQPKQPAMDDGRNNFMGRLDTVMRGAADTITFGGADELSAGLGAITGVGGKFGDLSGNLKAQREIDANDAEQRFGYRLLGQISGGALGGLGLARLGLSLGANAAKAGKSLFNVAKGTAADGAAIGGLTGFGSGEDLEGRAKGAAWGTGLGTVAGGVAPYGAALVSNAVKPLIAPVMSRLRPDAYAESALGEGMRRAGVTADDVAGRLASAVDDGQGMFTVADAMGNAGQRMLSTVARNPSDARQGVVEALLGRQMDQGRRVAGALEEASGSPLTAQQYKEMLAAKRAEDATRNYAPVKTDMSAIDVTGPVARANASISPAADRLAMAQGAVPTDLAARQGIERAESSISDPIREAIKSARAYLASPTSTITNVNKAFRAKTNIDQMIATATEKGQGALVAELMPLQQALDDALAAASKPYAAARNSYRSASEVVDAVDTGKSMAAPRSRPADNLSKFGALPNAEAQQAARVGYFDPLIARAERTAGTMTNSARPLISEGYRQELPVLANPGSAPRLERRIGREQQMFETSNAALGGSKSADNLADAADGARFDPSIMGHLFQGRPWQAAVTAVTRGIAEAQGNSTPVIERIAKALMERDPDVARQILQKGTATTATNDTRRAIVNMLLTSGGASPAGRLAAP